METELLVKELYNEAVEIFKEKLNLNIQLHNDFLEPSPCFKGQGAGCIFKELDWDANFYDFWIWIKDQNCGVRISDKIAMFNLSDPNLESKILEFSINELQKNMELKNEFFKNR